MLYNRKEKRVKRQLDCYKCDYFDKTAQKCNGIGKNCFEYDSKTKTVIDPITKLPIRL